MTENVQDAAATRMRDLLEDASGRLGGVWDPSENGAWNARFAGLVQAVAALGYQAHSDGRFALLAHVASAAHWWLESEVVANAVVDAVVERFSRPTGDSHE